jgi:hypothetical protein
MCERIIFFSYLPTLKIAKAIFFIFKTKQYDFGLSSSILLFIKNKY